MLKTIKKNAIYTLPQNQSNTSYMLTYNLYQFLSIIIQISVLND